MAFVIQACGRNLSPEEPCNFVQTKQLQRVSWEHNTPAKLYIDESVPREYWETIQKSAEVWNTLARKTIIEVYPNSGRASNMEVADNRSIIYMKEEWEANKPEEQAKTQVRWRGSQIMEADIFLNGAIYDFSILGDTPDDGVDLESLMIHEMGHVLGLNHFSDPETVMFKTLKKGQERRDFSKSHEEYNSLKCEY